MPALKQVKNLRAKCKQLLKLLSPDSVLNGDRAFFMPFFSQLAPLNKNNMGRGDKKTKKGKIFKGSFGKSRPATEKKTTGNQPAEATKKA